MPAVTYTHRVHYYETDQMGVVHHSNYIRWMEEARVHFFREVGLHEDFSARKGIICPVLSVNCDYKKMTHFDEIISIKVTLSWYKGVRMCVHYEMYNQQGDLCTVGDSTHTVLTTAGAPVRLRREFPALHQALIALASETMACLPQGSIE